MHDLVTLMNLPGVWQLWAAAPGGRESWYAPGDADARAFVDTAADIVNGMVRCPTGDATSVEEDAQLPLF